VTESVGRTDVRVEVAVGDDAGVGGTVVTVGAGVPVWVGLVGARARVSVSVLSAIGVAVPQAANKNMLRVMRMNFNTRLICTS
jgi:hypothetical protein